MGPSDNQNGETFQLCIASEDEAYSEDLFSLDKTGFLPVLRGSDPQSPALYTNKTPARCRGLTFWLRGQDLSGSGFARPVRFKALLCKAFRAEQQAHSPVHNQQKTRPFGRAVCWLRGQDLNL